MAKYVIEQIDVRICKEMLQDVAEKNCKLMHSRSISVQANIMRQIIETTKVVFAIYPQSGRYNSICIKMEYPLGLGDNIEAFYMPDIVSAQRLKVVYGNSHEDNLRRLNLKELGWTAKRLRHSVVPDAIERALYQPFDFKEFYNAVLPSNIRAQNKSFENDHKALMPKIWGLNQFNSGTPPNKLHIANSNKKIGAFKNWIIDHQEEMHLKGDYRWDETYYLEPDEISEDP